MPTRRPYSWKKNPRGERVICSLLGEMNGFGLHVIPMVGLILLSWLGLRSHGMERGAPPAAPGWPSGCTFPEVELPGGLSSQAVLTLLSLP